MSASLEEGRYGPPLQGGRVRRGGPDWPRLGLLLAGLVALFVVTVAVSAAAALWWGTRQLERVDVPELAIPGAPVEQDEEQDGADEDAPEPITEVLNVLVVGSDSREGLTEEQMLALGTEAENGLRTDTIMLLQLDPNREKVSVLSFPRDLLVTRCDGTRGRINAAYGIGETSGGEGASCLVRTVTDFTGIPVHHFIMVNFGGFIDIVDALGGVSLYLEEPIVDPYAGADFPAGCVRMTGTEALSFVRVRRLDSDFGRIARQQRFIREVVAEAASVGTLVNPPKLFSLVEAGARAVETDRRLSLNQMRRIAFSLRGLAPENLDMRTVPATPRRIGGADYVVADEEAAEALFAAFRQGVEAPTNLGTEGPQPVDVDDVPPITVLNGAGVSGLASEASEELEEAGFEVAGTDNADSFDVARTRVEHPSDLLEEAQLLASALGGARLVPKEEGGDLVVVLGADWEPGSTTRPAPRTIAGSEAPTASPLPEPSPTQTFVGAEPIDRDC